MTRTKPSKLQEPAGAFALMLGQILNGLQVSIRRLGRLRPSRRSGIAVTSATTGMVMIGLIMFGLDRAEISMAVGAFWGVLLLTCLWQCPPSENVFKLRSLQAIGVLFIILSSYIALSLFRGFSGPVQTYWDWVGDTAGTLNRSATLIELVRLMVLAAVFCVGLILGGSDRRATLALWTLCAAFSVYAVLALAQHVFWPGHVLWLPKTMFQDRMTGTFLSANVAAGVFGMMAMLTLSTIEVRLFSLPGRTKHDLTFVFQYAGAAALLACLVLTASRSGAIAFSAALTLNVVIFQWKKPQKITGVNRQWAHYVVPAALMVGLVLSTQVLMSRLANLDTDWSGRKTLFDLHWRAFTQSPLTGYGLGSFSDLNKLLVVPNSFGALWYVRATHNVYLQWMEETGVIGAALMFAIVGLILVEIVRGLAMRSSMHGLMRGVLAASALLMIQGLADFTLQTPGTAILWALILGLGYGVATGGHRSMVRDSASPKAWVRNLSVWSPRMLAATVQGLALVVLWGASSRAAEHGYPFALRSAYAQAASAEFEAPQSEVRDRRIRIDLLRGLRQGPTDPVLWLLAARLNDNLPASSAAFSRSYESSRVDPPLMKWRSAFAAAHWDQLSPQTRENVMSELSEFREGWGAEPWLRSLAARYRGTAFGAALTLTLMTPKEPAR